MITEERLEALLAYLKEHHPIPKSNLLVNYVDVDGFASSLSATGHKTAGQFLPLTPVKGLRYTGYIQIAMRSSQDLLTTVAHEYRHAMQFGLKLWSEDKWSEMECDAIKFARQVVPEFLAAS